MTDFIVVNARILTLAGDAAPRRSDAMNDLGIIEHGYLVVREGLIERVESGNPNDEFIASNENIPVCLLYTSPSPRDRTRSRMPSSA